MTMELFTALKTGKSSGRITASTNHSLYSHYAGFKRVTHTSYDHSKNGIENHQVAAVKAVELMVARWIDNNPNATQMLEPKIVGVSNTHSNGYTFLISGM